MKSYIIAETNEGKERPTPNIDTIEQRLSGGWIDRKSINNDMYVYP